MVLRFCIELFSFVFNAQPNHYLLLKSAFGCWEYFFPPYVLMWRRAGIADHLLMLCSTVVLISNRWARILWLTFSVSLLTCTELPFSSTVVQGLIKGTECSGHPEMWFQQFQKLGVHPCAWERRGCAHMDVPFYRCVLEWLGFDSWMWYLLCGHDCQGNW